MGGAVSAFPTARDTRSYIYARDILANRTQSISGTGSPRLAFDVIPGETTMTNKWREIQSGKIIWIK